VIMEHNVCEFCDKTFKRQSTFIHHICEYKRRYLEKDLVTNRIGFICWLNFYKKYTAIKKDLSYLDFIKNPYYTSFIKFGKYSVDIQNINSERYCDWLLKNQIKIDSWTKDQNYNKFLSEYLRDEDPFDALKRSIETTISIGLEDNIHSKDVLKYSNKNKLCYQIAKGKISPWILYQSDSGKKFMESLDETQVKMIYDYVNPELWAIKFSKNTDIVKQVQEILKLGGY
jgi:hypothetical protein